jgi:hypothetical protein
MYTKTGYSPNPTDLHKGKIPGIAEISKFSIISFCDSITLVKWISFQKYQENIMIDAEQLQTYDREKFTEIAGTLESADIEQLVDWLNVKNDDIRYRSFLLLQSRSQQTPDVYPYWDTFVHKFNSSNSYQRSIGLMLIAENTRWDDAGKLDEIIDVYLSFVDDEKPVTVRQCIQSLVKIVPYKKNLQAIIADQLMSIDLKLRKETQRKLLLTDILTVLMLIQRNEEYEEISRYIHNAMTGGLLDEKAIKKIEALA